MKVFAVLLLALCAVSLVFAHKNQRSSSGNFNDYDSDSDQQWQGQQQPTHWKSTNPTNPSEDPLASELTDLLPYQLKITQRIENSEVLKDQAETKEKLMKFLENKLHVCRTPNAGKHKVDRQCVGRLTGQMMQMIAMFEKGGQENMPVFNDW